MWGTVPSRYDTYCSSAGCFNGYDGSDSVENPWPSWENISPVCVFDAQTGVCDPVLFRYPPVGAIVECAGALPGRDVVLNQTFAKHFEEYRGIVGR